MSMSNGKVIGESFLGEEDFPVLILLDRIFGEIIVLIFATDKIRSYM